MNTVKYKAENHDHKKNNIYLLWHDTLIIPFFYLKKNKTNKLLVNVISSSNSGSLLAYVNKKFGYKIACIKSKNTHSRLDGFKGILKELQLYKDASIGITPDGSRGPAHVIKPGAIMLAKKLGIPIVLVGVACDRYYEFNTWDKFKLPKLFSTACIIYSEPIYIDRDLGIGQTKEKLIECQNLLNELTKKAQNKLK